MMNVSNFMKKKVFYIHEDDTIECAAKLMVENHIGTLPVVDQEMKLIGILTLGSLLRIILPDFIELISNFSFITNLGVFETKSPSREELNILIKEIMEEPVFVLEDWSLIHAAAILHNEELIDIPVVNSTKHLVGLASHVDIGTAIIQNWKN
jgi:CBS domain-containing protein